MAKKKEKEKEEVGKVKYVCAVCQTLVGNPFDECPKCGDNDMKRPKP